MPTYRYVCCVLDCNSIIIYLFIYFLSEVQNFVQLIEHFDEKGTCTSWRSVKHRTFSQTFSSFQNKVEELCITILWGTGQRNT